MNGNGKAPWPAATNTGLTAMATASEMQMSLVTPVMPNHDVTAAASAATSTAGMRTKAQANSSRSISIKESGWRAERAISQADLDLGLHQAAQLASTQRAQFPQSDRQHRRIRHRHGPQFGHQLRGPLQRPGIVVSPG